LSSVISSLRDLTNLAPTEENEPPFLRFVAVPGASSSGLQTSTTSGLEEARSAVSKSALRVSLFLSRNSSQ